MKFSLVLLVVASSLIGSESYATRGKVVLGTAGKWNGQPSACVDNNNELICACDGTQGVNQCATCTTSCCGSAAADCSGFSVNPNQTINKRK